MSDFLQFKDEIIDGNAKYYVTDNADGTKNIALANTVIEQGTSLSNAGLQRINSIMGYNETEVDTGTKPTPSEYVDIDYIGISPTWTSTIGNLDTQTINGTMSTISDIQLGEYTPTFNITHSLRYFKNDTTIREDSRNICLWSNPSSSSVATTSDSFMNCLNEKTTSKTIEIGSYYLLNSVYPIEWKYDLKQNQTNKKLDISIKAIQQHCNIQIKVSSDDINYTTIKTLSVGNIGTNTASFNDTIGKYRYLKLIIWGDEQADDRPMDLVIQKLNIQIQKYELKNVNRFTTDVIEHVEDGQKICITTPDFQMGAIENTLNDIEISKLLNPNMNYNLVYDKDNYIWNVDSSAITLFDITLEEPVNQIILSNIDNKLNDFTFYALFIIGSVTTGAGVSLNGVNIMFSMTTTNNSYVHDFSYYNKIIIPDQVSLTDDSIHLTLSGAGSPKFNVGTRIIIKEVA